MYHVKFLFLFILLITKYWGLSSNGFASHLGFVDCSIAVSRQALQKEELSDHCAGPAELFKWLKCTLAASGATSISTFQTHNAAIPTIITHDSLPSGLVAQSVEQRTIKSGVRGLDSQRGRTDFHHILSITGLNTHQRLAAQHQFLPFTHTMPQFPP